MANPTRSKVKQRRGAARSTRASGRPLEAGSNAGPREMILLRPRAGTELGLFRALSGLLSGRTGNGQTRP
jgi:hypothetical protein